MPSDELTDRVFNDLSLRINQIISDAGGNLRNATDAQRAEVEALRRQQKWETYRRLGGETEARNVQTRRDFTPEQRREQPPWLTQDVPDDQQIVRFGDGPSNALGDAIRVGAGLGGIGLAGDFTLRQYLRDNMQGS